MNTNEILDYEIRSSPINRLMGYAILPGWATSLLARYFARKVRIKTARYKASIQERNSLIAKHGSGDFHAIREKLKKELEQPTPARL